MDIRTLEWLDTHVVHHRFQQRWFDVLHPLLKWLICDRFERALGPIDDWTDDPRVGLEEVEGRLAELQILAAERTATMPDYPDPDDAVYDGYEALAAARNEEDAAFEAAMRRRVRDRFAD